MPHCVAHNDSHTHTATLCVRTLSVVLNLTTSAEIAYNSIAHLTSNNRREQPTKQYEKGKGTM